MASDDDWRLQGQERHLAGRTLRFTKWWSYRQGWDHDHCELCWSKIWDRATGDDEHDSAYVTADDEYHWICSRCFHDFRLRFRWTVIIE
ncbi:MAG TPA: hypothetical protein VK988_03320 [Acidimicrobiales bacterium]|nr:hypothetical protein [Acidimicrobiales bacterium]